ncbi:galactokinase [Microlunatus endophyticus]|uniref:Galactokinase n=1 Tax=Microlunatus endophyticus TaxID=1716077 RepID=A0A917S5Z3_9ACTN|nr:galactokinase [Microlunatus endophyticus]GGL55785.1 galactokinase [Microlunatus endophyticus]
MDQHVDQHQQQLLRDRSTQLFGRLPAGVWAAPGRVNLIGEHTDYNDGFVMPFALAEQTLVAASPTADEHWTVHSSTIGDGETVSFGPDELVPGMAGWQAYVAGIVWALREAGHAVGGAELMISSTVPVGAGLSSSAALECAVLTALIDLYGLEIEPLDRAILARRCENEFVGAPTGLMDQAASTLCTGDHALFFDCRDYAHEQVPLELAAAGLELLVLDTRTPHAHVDGEYAARRRSCEEAAGILGVPALRDVDDLDAALQKLTDDTMRRRVRHVVTENERVLLARTVLSDGSRTPAERFAAVAPLLDASHASMRDDFEITVPTVDLAVETARRAGALGARMTGGGFGGCIIALVPAGTADSVAAAVATAFADAGFGAPAHFLGVPSDGARRLAA